MSRIEKMEKYIARTKKPNARYDLYYWDIDAIYHLMEQNQVQAISLAFTYGRAKGYRAARKEARA